MENYLLQIPSILNDLRKSQSTEKSIERLTTLNEIISSSQEEMEFLEKINGIHVIMKCMENDEKLVNICLKIFANASKKEDKIRKKLSKSNIFTLMAMHLQKEKDFSRTNIILYAALIVILVQGNFEAQDQMRLSGCLSVIAHILSCILYDSSNKVSYRNTELVVYAITACIKNPKHFGNQTEVGWITIKIVAHLENNIFLNAAKPQLVKCLWSLLKYILDGHEANQKTFMQCSGFIVLYKSMQEVIDEKKCEEMGELLAKMTGLLVKLKTQKEFLCLSANYCSITILCNLMNSFNVLVIQHVIIFLDVLTREIHYSVHIMKDKRITAALKRAQIILYKNAATTELCKDIRNRVESFANGAKSSQEDLFTSNGNLSSDLILSQKRSLYSSQLDFCILHDTKPEVGIHSKIKLDGSNKNDFNISTSPDLNQNDKLELQINQNFLNRHAKKKSKSKFKISKIFSHSLFRIFRKLRSFFFKTPSSNYLNGSVKRHQAFLIPNDDCEFLNAQMLLCRRKALHKNLQDVGF